jgi:hypothetical protein
VDCADRIGQMIEDTASDPLIVCPTHGRAGRVRLFDVLPDVPLCVAESQAPLYRDAYPDAELIVHPDEVVGIAPKRQWLLDRHPEVFMFDDDVKAVVDLGARPGEKARMTPEAVRGHVERLFDMARALDVYGVGFSSYGDPTLYRPHRPFALTGFLSGHALGLRRSPKIKLPYPAAPWLLTDDLYVSALMHFHHRRVLREDAVGIVAEKTWKGTGGMATHRTWRRVVENEKYLKELFGDAIVRRSDTARSSLTVEIQLTLKVPWA